MKTLIFKLMAHKLVLFTALSVGTDLGTSIAVHQRTKAFPDAGQTYLGSDGLLRTSPGPSHDLTLGNSGPFVMSVTIPAPMISTLLLGHKAPKPERKVLVGEMAVGAADSALNIHTMRWYDKYPMPVKTRTAWR